MTAFLKGAGLDLDTYLSYSNRRRAVIRREVKRRIEEHNEAVEGGHVEDD